MNHPWIRSNRCIAALITLVLSVVVGCSASGREGAAEGGAEADAVTESAAHGAKPKYALTRADTAGLSQAIFAGGCFWCLETAFEGVKGVRSVISGFVGGRERNPAYDQVSAGDTGHTEAVLVTFDPKTIGYPRLLEIFWVNHDPTTGDRQFCDRGHQYRPGIFYRDAVQKRQAEASVAWARKRGRFEGPIATEITPATAFWPAEEYHQDFYKKDPVRYRSYRIGCGRDARLAQLWGTTARH